MLRTLLSVGIVAGIMGIYMWTRSANRKAGGKSSGVGLSECGSCGDASCGSSETAKVAVNSDKKYDGIFFDLDGTLIDSCRDLTDALNYAAEGLIGRKLTAEEVKPKLGFGMIKLVESILPEGSDEEVIQRTYSVFTEYYNEHKGSNTYSYEGIKPLLEELKAEGYKLAVVTNKDGDIARPLVNDFFSGIFDVIVGRSKVLNKKPDPGMMRFAMSAAGVSPEKVLYIGDSEVDKEFALASGTDYLLVSWGFRKKEDMEKIAEGRLIEKAKEVYNFI